RKRAARRLDPAAEFAEQRGSFFAGRRGWRLGGARTRRLSRRFRLRVLFFVAATQRVDFGLLGRFLFGALALCVLKRAAVIFFGLRTLFAGFAFGHCAADCVLAAARLVVANAARLRLGFGFGGLSGRSWGARAQWRGHAWARRRRRCCRAARARTVHGALLTH